MQNITKWVRFPLIALIAALGFQAHADLSWSFSYKDIQTGGQSIDVSGTLTTTSVLINDVGGTGVSGYEIVSISGTRNGLAITGLNVDANSPNNIILNNVEFDNMLLVPGQFDYFGLSYFVGANEYNLFSQNNPLGGGDYEAPNGTFDYVPVELTLTAVPEPSTIFAGALLVLPLGISAVRILRSRRSA
jgi:hypothetical protein